MTVALTYSEGRLGTLERLLVARGYRAVRVPLVRTEPLLHDGARSEAQALLSLPWLLFTSPSAVRAWRALGLPLGSSDGSSRPSDGSSRSDAFPRVGAVGTATARALRDAGAEVALISREGNAAGLARAFLRHPRAGGPVGLPRGDRALPVLPDALEAAGFEIRSATIYQTVTLPWSTGRADAAADPLDEGVEDGVEDAAVDAVVLASPSAVAQVPEWVGSSARLVALGPSTARAVRARGWRCRVAARPTAGAVLRALEERGNEPDEGGTNEAEGRGS